MMLPLDALVRSEGLPTGEGIGAALASQIKHANRFLDQLYSEHHGAEEYASHIKAQVHMPWLSSTHPPLLMILATEPVNFGGFAHIELQVPS
eukprot:3509605-Amphidinium_carterae.1